MRNLILISLIFLLWPAEAQLTVGGSTQVTVRGELALNGGLLNRSASLDLAQTGLILSGEGGQLNSSVPLSVRAIRIDGAGKFPIQGDWSVKQSLQFIKGIVVPSGLFLYEGGKTLQGNPESYVSGTFYQKGNGVRFYPVGTDDTYMPMSLNEVGSGNEAIGVRPSTGAISVTLPADLSAVATNRYWEILPASGARALSASLYLPGSSLEGQNNLSVVQADNSAGAVADNLRGGPTKDFVTGFLKVNKPLLTIGIAAIPQVQIHDLITPFNLDDVNDKLKIVNIESTISNKVFLLDRYGVLIREWVNFRNYDDPENTSPDNYDFTRLSPGNYICVLEYKLSAEGETKKLTQMISVLKDK